MIPKIIPCYNPPMIKIYTGGKKHDPWLAAAIAEYEKRLAKYWMISWRFVPDDKFDQLLKQIPPTDFVILLDEHGENVTSEILSAKIAQKIEQDQQISLIIGGSYGVPESIKSRANWTWSLSNLVFPHKICRLLVTEQLYRAQQIHQNHPYHHN